MCISWINFFALDCTSLSQVNSLSFCSFWRTKHWKLNGNTVEPTRECLRSCLWKFFSKSIVFLAYVSQRQSMEQNYLVLELPSAVIRDDLFKVQKHLKVHWINWSKILWADMDYSFIRSSKTNFRKYEHEKK